jgi:hypothetical protein
MGELVTGRFPLRYQFLDYCFSQSDNVNDLDGVLKDNGLTFVRPFSFCLQSLSQRRISELQLDNAARGARAWHFHKHQSRP